MSEVEHRLSKKKSLLNGALFHEFVTWNKRPIGLRSGQKARRKNHPQRMTVTARSIN
jgi:hypothetical protein